MYFSTATDAPATAPRSAGCSERSLACSASTIALYCATVRSANMRIVAGALVLYFLTMLRATSFQVTVATVSGVLAARAVDGSDGATRVAESWHAATNARESAPAQRPTRRAYDDDMTGSCLRIVVVCADHPAIP